MYQYCPKIWSLRSLEYASVNQKLTILEHKNGLVLTNTRVPVSGTWSILFPESLTMIHFSPTTSPFLHRFKWLTPHFEGNYNIFRSNIILLKTNEFEIFMNMPTVPNRMYNKGVISELIYLGPCQMDFLLCMYVHLTLKTYSTLIWTHTIRTTGAPNQSFRWREFKSHRCHQMSQP